MVCNGFLSPQGCFNLSSTGHDKGEGQAAMVNLLRLQSKILGDMPVAVKVLGGFLVGEGKHTCSYFLVLPTEKASHNIMHFLYKLEVICCFSHLCMLLCV